jgi:hypothetical protein
MLRFVRMAGIIDCRLDCVIQVILVLMFAISIFIKRIVLYSMELTTDFAFLMVVEVLEQVQSECSSLFIHCANVRKSHLASFLPAHPLKDSLLHATCENIEPSAAAPFGSASILLISYAYIKMMGIFACRIYSYPRH